MSSKQSDAHLDFYTKFKAKSADILEALSSKDLDTLRASTSALHKTLQDNQDNLPVHDKRIYEQDIRQIEAKLESLRKAQSNNSKFSFSRSKKKSKPAPTVASEVLPAPSLFTSVPDSSILNISSVSSEVITTDSLGLQIEQRSLTISNVSNSLVDLRGTQSLLACHAKTISNSVIILPHITGSVILYVLTNCLVVAQCQQFRIHSSINTTVLLHISSTPIIESSNLLRFGTIKVPPCPTDSQSRHDLVQDFDCPGAESPNWSKLDPQIETELNLKLRSSSSSLDSFLCHLHRVHNKSDD